MPAEHEKLTGLIAGSRFSNPEQQQLLDSIGQNNEAMADLFSQLVSAYGSGDTGAEDRLVGLLLLRSYEADTNASRLASVLGDDIRTSEVQMMGLILLVLAAATVPLTNLLRRTRRSITSSLSSLSQGAAVIGAGNLDYRIEEKGSDEITELSRSFNRMTSSLKKVTASKADLEMEIDRRNEVEEKLRISNEHLQDQTEKLEEGVEVRKRAEEQAQELVEELKVHQEELEAQADELRQSQGETREARDKFIDLYDYAPVGYLTLEKDGGILEVNLTAASMLGSERSKLIRSKLVHFIQPESQDEFYLHLNKVPESGRKQTCEIKMHSADGNPFQAKLESIAVNTGEKAVSIRTNLMDITERKKAEDALK